RLRRAIERRRDDAPDRPDDDAVERRVGHDSDGQTEHPPCHPLAGNYALGFQHVTGCPTPVAVTPMSGSYASGAPPSSGTSPPSPSSFSRWRKMVRGSTPRSRAVLVRLPLFSSSTWLMYSRWNFSLASDSGKIAGRTSAVRPRSSGPSSALSASTHAFLMWFSSCRMLPGQPNLRMAMTAFGDSPFTMPPNSCE